MKKLVIAGGIIIAVLVMVLCVMFFSGSAGKDISAVFGGGNEKDSKTEDEYSEYDGELLKTRGMASIKYSGRDFNVEFKNPFYGSNQSLGVNVTFYDELHGYLMNSLGSGSNSEFYECYKTEDGGRNWDRCKEDMWFSASGINFIRMASDHEMVCVRRLNDLEIGDEYVEVSYSEDGGDTWITYDDGIVDEDREEILAIIRQFTLYEKIEQLFITTREALEANWDPSRELTVNLYNLMDYDTIGGLLYTSPDSYEKSDLEYEMKKAQDYSYEFTGMPAFIVAWNNDKDVDLDIDPDDTDELNDDDSIIITGPQFNVNGVFYMTMEDAPSSSYQTWPNSYITGDKGKLEEEVEETASETGLVPNIFEDEEPSETEESAEGSEAETEASASETDTLESEFSEEPVEEEDYSVNMVLVKNDASKVVPALQDGADMIIVTSNYTDAYLAALNAAKKGELTEQQINRALYHIYKAKLHYMQEKNN